MIGSPREAAVAIVNLINHRNPNVSLLALTVSSRVAEEAVTLTT